MKKSSKSQKMIQYKCKNCGKHWMDEKRKLTIEECPFCGSPSLNREEIRIKL